MRSHEARDLPAQFEILGRAHEAAMRHAFEHMQLGWNLRAAQRAMQAHGVGQEEVAGCRSG
ncbi:hypothetical protein LFL97_22200 [Burkholderia sp. JSH-S8]|nr:hypothetical protein LFL97_22200 [Burkholderia sp. JSH-S8]